MRTFLQFFSLASLGIKILSAHIMQEPIFWLFTTWYPVKYMNVGENQSFSWEKSYFCHISRVAIPYFPIFLICPITWYPGLDWWIFVVPNVIKLLSKKNNSGKKWFLTKIVFLFPSEGWFFSCFSFSSNPLWGLKLHYDRNDMEFRHFIGFR